MSEADIAADVARVEAVSAALGAPPKMVWITAFDTRHDQGNSHVHSTHAGAVQELRGWIEDDLARQNIDQEQHDEMLQQLYKNASPFCEPREIYYRIEEHEVHV